MCTNFQTKRTILNFWAQICPKMNFGVGISKIYGQLLIFWPKFGKLPNYVQYFGSNIVEGVAESWVEVSARFSNTRSLAIFLALFNMIIPFVKLFVLA